MAGVAVYHAGFREQLASNGELTALGNAMYRARELAMDRLDGEASRLRADGVVGVRLETGRQLRAKNGHPFTSDLSGHADGVVGLRIQENHHRWGTHTIEFSAIGTAVVALPDAGAISPPVTVLPLDGQRG